MPASIYLYEDLNQYQKLYPRNTPPEEEIPIQGIFMYRPKNAIWIVVDALKKIGPVSKQHRLNIILHGIRGFEKFKDEADKFVSVENLQYYYKERQIVFRLEDQVKKFTANRYIGERVSRGRIKDFTSPHVPIDSYKFYDMARNRLNFILNTSS